MSTKNLIKEELQNFKYELMFVKHKLDLVENLITGLEERVYSDDPVNPTEERLLDIRAKLLLEEYQKLKDLINPHKIKFNSEKSTEELNEFK